MYITTMLKQIFPSLPPQAKENTARHATKGLLR